MAGQYIRVSSPLLAAGLSVANSAATLNATSLIIPTQGSKLYMGFTTTTPGYTTQFTSISANIDPDMVISRTSSQPCIALLGNGTGNWPEFAGLASRGTFAAPTATANNDVLLLLTAYGYNTTNGFGANGVASGPSILMRAKAAYTSTIQPSQIEFYTTQLAAAGSRQTAILDTEGNFALQTAGQGLRVKEGSNAKQGTAVLVAGTLVVSNTAVTANSRIFLTSQVDGGTPGFLRVSTRTAATSFTILSSSNTDTSTVAYQIFEPS